MNEWSDRRHSKNANMKSKSDGDFQIKFVPWMPWHLEVPQPTESFIIYLPSDVSEIHVTGVDFVTFELLLFLTSPRKLQFLMEIEKITGKYLSHVYSATIASSGEIREAKFHT